MKIWENMGMDEGSVHPIGNGELLVYEQGSNIIQVYGPHYTSPSFLDLSIYEPNKDIRTESIREKGTAVWHHHIYSKGEKIADFVDYVLPDKNIFFREWKAIEELHFKITPAPPLFFDLMDKSEIDVYNLGGHFENIKTPTETLLLRFPKGTRFGKRLTTNTEASLMFVADGNVSFSNIKDKEYEVCIKPGEGRFLISCDASYTHLVENVEYILKHNEECWVEQVRNYWSNFTSRRKDFSDIIPLDYSRREFVLDTIDSVSVLIKCQQSRSGGVMAGHFYCFAYIRDQSGVLRGLLELGYIEEAKSILKYWLRIFELFGNLCDADGMGNETIRLPWFNDEVEVTSYIILDYFKYYDYTQDDELLKQAFPLMVWAFEVQLPHLVKAMIEFNSDETYIAGGVLPLQYLYNGSAEATLLFITAGERLMKWARGNSVWTENKLYTYERILSDTKAKYKENFIKDDIFYANNPLREKNAGTPRFRYSYCEATDCVEDRNTPITWTEKNSQGYYVCPKCRNKILPEMKEKEKRYVLNSVCLVPQYIDNDIFSVLEIEKFIEPGISTFKAKGMIPSDIYGTRSLGYDYGLMLYNLVKLNHPLKEQLLDKILDVLDPTGAWVEYYDNDVPASSCCRSRPWESAINIEAILAYFKALK